MVVVDPEMAKKERKAWVDAGKMVGNLITSTISVVSIVMNQVVLRELE
jgi:hypothetical protein